MCVYNIMTCDCQTDSVGRVSGQVEAMSGSRGWNIFMRVFVTFNMFYSNKNSNSVVWCIGERKISLFLWIFPAKGGFLRRPLLFAKFGL